jgi:hypothetical protein
MAHLLRILISADLCKWRAVGSGEDVCLWLSHVSRRRKQERDHHEAKAIKWDGKVLVTTYIPKSRTAGCGGTWLSSQHSGGWGRRPGQVCSRITVNSTTKTTCCASGEDGEKKVWLKVYENYIKIVLPTCSPQGLLQDPQTCFWVHCEHNTL